MKGEIGAQARKASGSPFVMAEEGPAFPAYVAKERNRELGQDLTEEAGRVHADLKGNAKEREVCTWRQFKVFPPTKIGAQTKAVKDTQPALTWKKAAGEGMAKARLVAK